jgi:hypothetical protein
MIHQFNDSGPAPDLDAFDPCNPQDVSWRKLFPQPRDGPSHIKPEQYEILKREPEANEEPPD